MNNCVLIGRLTSTPELRYAPETETAVCSFTLAVDRFGKDKGADFIRIKCFAKTAENCQKYLDKGKQCAVEGRINTGSYKNKDGVTVYTTDVVANRVEFLGSKSEQQQPSEPQQEFTAPTGFSIIDDYEEDPDALPF